MGQISAIADRQLVVFIPTYNRSVLLLRAIKSAVQNFPAFQKPYIVISDSSDNDEAVTVVDDCKLAYPEADIIYYKNPKNGGLDVNMLRYLHIDIGAKYGLMLGDDDIVTPLFKTKIEQHIDKDFDMLLLNVTAIENDQVLELNSDKDVTDLFNLTWDKMPFGSIVVNLHAAGHYKDVYPKYINTSHAYSAIVWEIIAGPNSTDRVILTNGRSVAYGDEIKTWSAYNFDIFLNGIPRWLELLPQNITSKRDVLKKYSRQYYTLYMFIKLLEGSYPDKDNLIRVFLLKFKGLKRLLYKQLYNYHSKYGKVPALAKAPFQLKAYLRTLSKK